MADIGHELTDDLLKGLEERIKEEYEIAVADAERKYAAWLKKFTRQREEQQALFEAGQITKTEYPQCAFDDAVTPRKCISWRECFIGFGHCEYTSKSSVLFQNFVLDFPAEFAAAKVREIHSGHLHRESVDDGIMVRRLPSAVPTDEWSSNNGYIGAHKRFQLFEWSPGRLKAIYYV